MLDELEDLQLIALSDERMKNYDSERSLSSEEINKKYGYNDPDLSDADEIKFE